MLKSLVRKCLTLTPYELKRKTVLAKDTLSAIELGLAVFKSRGITEPIVQIGAFDGVSFDPLRDFIKADTHTAILVEPIEQSFQKLSSLYEGAKNIHLKNVAIAETDGTATMYRAKQEGRWADHQVVKQLASFDPQHLVWHGVELHELEKVQVKAVSLDTLVSEFQLDSIGFLQIDTEGFDAEVVRMALKQSIPPKMINFESSHLKKDDAAKLFQELQNHSYVWIHSGWDTFAVHRSVAESWFN